MVITEYYKIRADGVALNRTYSDKGMMIERDGVRYDEAIDPAELNRQYTDPPTVDDGYYAVQVWSVHDIPVSDATDTIS